MPNNFFLVDTSAWLFALRKDYIPIVKERIIHLLRENAIITTGIVKLEILGGIKREKEFQRLKTRFDALFFNIQCITSPGPKSFSMGRSKRMKAKTDVLPIEFQCFYRKMCCP